MQGAYAVVFHLGDSQETSFSGLPLDQAERFWWHRRIVGDATGEAGCLSLPFSLASRLLRLRIGRRLEIVGDRFRVAEEPHEGMGPLRKAEIQRWKLPLPKDEYRELWHTTRRFQRHWKSLGGSKDSA